MTWGRGSAVEMSDISSSSPSNTKNVRQHQEFANAVGFKHISVSLCNSSAENRHKEFEESIAISSNESRSKFSLVALSRFWTN